MASPHDQEITAALDDVLRKVGADPDSFDGQLVRDMMTTSLKLIRDGADTGEIKLISRALKELRYAMKVFRPYREVRKISVFGSARTAEDHPHYKAAVDFSRRVSDRGWMVITGAGDGIMKAGHGGAGKPSSFGVSIRLPFETTANSIISGDSKLITFRYFFTRKLLFVSQCHAIALFPGGFGTHDEGFEVLTLIQTGKTPIVPLVMVDAPGDDYWKQWDVYIKNHLLAKGMISPDDLNLYYVTDSPKAAAHHVFDFYRNYHSQRFVDDRLVLRIHRPLTHAQLTELNTDFASLVAEGEIEQSKAVEGEHDHLELQRLSWISTRRGYGKLRQLIDRVNQFAGAPSHP